MRTEKKRRFEPGFGGGLPIIEFTGNRRVLVEGSTGIVRYESEAVSLNTRRMLVTFNGRGLTLRSISPTAVIVDGVILSTEFLSYAT